MTPEIERKQLEARKLILEMIDAAMDLAEEKGPHSLSPGCNCIVCVGKRKQLLRGEPKHWKYTL